MYIEDKLFSENTGEPVYQVLLSEDEYSLFSVFQKEFVSIIPKVLINFRNKEAIEGAIRVAKAVERSSKQGMVPVNRIIPMR